MNPTSIERIETDGLSEAGIWVRRWREPVSVSDEIWALANVLQTWNLNRTMSILTYESAYVEISGPDLQPTWVYLIELVGHRAYADPLINNHPLSQVGLDDPARVLAVVEPNSHACLGALIETRKKRRMIWVQPAVVH
jgi:hypothetical protein